MNSEELRDFKAISNMVGVIKQRIMGWAGLVASTGKKKGTSSVLIGKREARDHTEGVAVHGKLLLRCVFEKGDDDAGDVNWVRLA